MNGNESNRDEGLSQSPGATWHTHRSAALRAAARPMLAKRSGFYRCASTIRRCCGSQTRAPAFGQQFLKLRPQSAGALRSVGSGQPGCRRSARVLVPATDFSGRHRFSLHSFKLAGSEAYVLPENHYGGHMDGARARVDACGWSCRGLSGFVRCRNGAGTSSGSPAGHRAIWGIRAPCGRSLILSDCARQFQSSHLDKYRDRGRRESRRRTLA